MLKRCDISGSMKFLIELNRTVVPWCRFLSGFGGYIYAAE